MRMAITISPTRVLRLLLVLAFALPLAIAFRLEMGMLLVASRLMMRLTATVRAGDFELGLGLGNPHGGLRRTNGRATNRLLRRELGLDLFDRHVRIRRCSDDGRDVRAVGQR